jgi:hypothetical protein
MRLASTTEGADVGKSIPDLPLRLEDKKPEEDKESDGNAREKMEVAFRPFPFLKLLIIPLACVCWLVLDGGRLHMF